MKADCHERPLYNLSGMVRTGRRGRPINHAGEVSNALFRLDSRDPIKADAAGVKMTSGRNRPDLDRFPFVEAKKDVDILRGLSVAAAMHAAFVFQAILTAASIIRLR